MAEALAPGNPPSIVFFESTGKEKQYFRQSLRGYPTLFLVEPVREPLSTEAAGSLKDAVLVSIFIRSKVDRRFLEAAPSLQLIATRSTGHDHIDLEACRERGVFVANVPFYGENTVAEHTFALILSLSRRVHKAYLQVRRGKFSDESLRGFELKGKIIGVIGAGRIGLHVVRVAKGFEMKALAFDVKKDDFLAEILGFEYVPMDELLRRSDIISLHAPYNAATHHLINKDNVSIIKRGAILINTARGGLVDTEALIWALDQKILAGAGLDVVEGEELIEEEEYLLKQSPSRDVLQTLLRNHVLLQREDVIITPHNAFNSREAVQRIMSTTAGNILRFIAGRPQNLV